MSRDRASSFFMGFSLAVQHGRIQDRDTNRVDGLVSSLLSMVLDLLDFD